MGTFWLQRYAYHNSNQLINKFREDCLNFSPPYSIVKRGLAAFDRNQLLPDSAPELKDQFFLAINNSDLHNISFFAECMHLLMNYLILHTGYQICI